MSTEDRSTKRRRTDDAADEVPSAVPSVVLSASVSPEGRDEGHVQLTAPALEEIPELIVQIASDDKDDVAAALSDLNNLIRNKTCPDFRANKDTATSCGAPSFVIMAMRKWQHQKIVQGRGCACLLIFAHDPDLTQKVVISMAQMGGLEAVLDAVKLFPDSASVVEKGLGALRNILCSNTVRVKHGDRFLNQIGGASTVVEAMKRHLDSAKVQEIGCFCLNLLAKEKELREALLKSGSMSAISASVEKYPDHQAIKSAVAAFTKRMFSDS